MKKLSIIIPTRNRAKLLALTLRSIHQQTMRADEFEVIVVDNGSTDDTPQVTSEYGNKLDIKTIFEPSPGLHVGRHKGLSVSSAELLVFIDDDIEANPRWIETIHEVFQRDSGIALVGGKNTPNYECAPPFWILEMWNKRISLGHVLSDLSVLDFGDESKEISPYYIFGCNFSVRKDIILRAGGFHPDGFPFDMIKYRGDGETHISDFVSEKGLKAFYHPGASVRHWVPAERMTEDYFCRRRYMQGVSAAYTELRSGRKMVSSRTSIMTRLKRKYKTFTGSTQMELLNEMSKSLLKTDFERRMYRSYCAGKDYLIHLYESDEAIRSWVHKQDYF